MGLIPAAVVLFGLLVGSFLNVCIYRLPLGQSVVVPRSYCPDCGRFIRWFDNVPLLSYLLLKGRCRACSRPIPIRYPVVEGLSGLLSLAVYWRFPGWPSYFCLYLLLTAPLVVVTFIDLRHKIIPNEITLPGVVIGIAVSLLLTAGPIGPGDLTERLIRSLTGATAGGLTLFSVSWLYERIRGQTGIGMGDVKLAAMLGAFFGWKGIFVTLFLSSFTGSLVGLVLILLFRKGFRFEIPYGPFISLGALLNLFFGRELVRAYLNLTGL